MRHILSYKNLLPLLLLMLMLTACGFGFNVGEDGVDVDVGETEDAGETDDAGKTEDSTVNVPPPSDTIAIYGYPYILHFNYIISGNDNGIVTYNILATNSYHSVYIYVFASESSHTQLKIVSGKHAFVPSATGGSYGRRNTSGANSSYPDATKQYSSSHGKYMQFVYEDNYMKVGDEIIIEVENSTLPDTYRFKLKVS